MTDSSSPCPLPPSSAMPEHVARYRRVYAITPGERLVRREFGFYCLEAWYEQGLDPEADLAAEFGFDPEAAHSLWGLGWCEAELVPAFTEAVIEDRGDCEVIRDHAGRHLLVFRGRRSGFMPEYIAHPVSDRRSWEEQIAWRLDPDSPQRLSASEERIAAALPLARQGYWMVQHVIGGYMFLRSLIGPEALLLAFYDDPELIHTCMRAWLALADRTIARHQQHLCFDELFFGEDICYNNGPLISPAMIEEFLFPYYQQLIANMRARRRDPQRRLHVHLDTDGFCDPVLDLYRHGIGMDVCSPFEVASGCDVVRTGRAYPEMVIKGGIDKRVLAAGPAAIDAMLERIIPSMRARGGYIPTCDHGVPSEVPLAAYRHYRRRIIELGG